jgi:hypothetical protein
MHFSPSIYNILLFYALKDTSLIKRMQYLTNLLFVEIRLKRENQMFPLKLFRNVTTTT